MKSNSSYSTDRRKLSNPSTSSLTSISTNKASNYGDNTSAFRLNQNTTIETSHAKLYENLLNRYHSVSNPY